jgi:hypothetical protein
LLYGSDMTRALLLGLVVMAAACGGKTFESLCANQVPPPAACATSCDPAPGATTACPDGYHCGAAGKCDAVCTLTGGQCGDGYACTVDGSCVSNNTGSDPGSNTDTDACPSAHFTASKTTPSIQLLIDRSGSMLDGFKPKQPVDPTNNPQKYSTEVSALIGANGVVNTLQASAYIGASMFPSNSCPAILKTPRSMNNATTISTFLNSNAPFSSDAMGNRNTPTPDAINAAVADFTANPPPAGSPPIIVLATDGLPNSCTDGNTGTQPQSVKAVQDAFKAGVKTYYLFVGDLSALGAGNQDHPQQMANAGAGLAPTGATKAKFYNATDPGSLSSAFSEIIKGVLSCDLQLNGKVNADQAQGGTVTLDGVTLAYGTDWTVDQDGVTLHILGAKCTQLKSEPDPKVDATFSCGAVIIF